MNQIERVQSKVEQIEILFHELRQELDVLRIEWERVNMAKAKRKESPLPTEAEAQQDFSRLYAAYLEGNTVPITDFVNENSKDYLSAFFRWNNIAVDTKRIPKKDFVKEIIQRFAQRKAITGNVFSK